MQNTFDFLLMLFLILFLGETVGFVKKLDINYELLSFFVDSFNSVCTTLILEIFLGGIWFHIILPIV